VKPRPLLNVTAARIVVVLRKQVVVPPVPARRWQYAGFAEILLCFLSFEIDVKMVM